MHHHVGMTGGSRTPFLAIDNAAERCVAAGHPTRLKILLALADAGSEGLPAGSLAADLGVPPALLSSHLRILDHAQMISRQRHGRRILSHLRRDELTELATFLGSIATE